MKQINRWLVLLIIFTSLQMNIQASNTTKTSDQMNHLKEVLVLCSYDYSMVWEKRILETFTQQLSETYNQKVNITVEFMDTQKNVSDSYQLKLESLLLEKYKNKSFDVIVAIDNAALSFTNKYYDELFSESQVVFLGINGFDDKMVSNITHYVGLKEEIFISENISLIKTVKPNVEKIYIVNDNSFTGKIIDKVIEADLSKVDRQDIVRVDTLSLEYVAQTLKVATKQDAVLLLSFTRGEDGNTFSYENMCETLTASTSATVFGVWDFYLSHGVAGGYMANSEAQGKEGAVLVGKILTQGKIPNQIIEGKGNSFIFDEQVLKAHHIKLKQMPIDSKVVYVASENDKYNQIQYIILTLLVVIGIILLSVWIYLRSKKKKTELTKVADIDYLTGIYNRRKGLEIIEANIKKSIPRSEEYALIFFDLDGLKMINDNFGHNEGDEYIKDCILLIKQFIRKDDVFLRFGGDEFILVLKYSDLNVAERICVRIESSLEESNKKSYKRYQISFSWGIETFIATEQTNIDMIINMADQKMYTAKHLKKALKNRG